MEIAASVVLARLLTPYDFGIAAAVGFFLRLANKLSTIGFGGALVRLKEVRSEHVSSVFVAALAMSVMMWLMLTASAPVLATVFRDEAIGPAIRVGALIYLLLPFGIGQMAEMHRQFRFRHKAVVGWVHAATFLILSISLALGGFGYWSLIWSALLANAASTLTKIYLGGVQPRLRFSKSAFMEVIPFGVGLQAKRILTFCAEYLDNLVVGRVVGVTALGFYDKAFSTVDRVVDRLAAGPTVFFRIFSIMRDDPDRLRRAYRKSVLAVSLLGLPTFAVLIVLGPELIPFVYGEQWRFSVLPFQILCVAGAFRVSSAYASAATQAHGQIWAEIARLCLFVALVIAGAWIGSGWGIAGVAVGVAIANGVMSLLMQTLVCKLTDLQWREVFEPQLMALCIAAMFAVAMLGAQAGLEVIRPGATEWQHLALKVFVAAATALIVFLKPPFRAVLDVRNEMLHDLTPKLIPYLPVWADVDSAHNTPRPQRRLPTAAIRPVKEDHVSGI
jgi:O-antigen/teichoic acid export membrane protein